MTTSTTTLTASFCSPNGGHVTLSALGLGSVTVETSELAGVPANSEVGAALIVLARFHMRNLTPAQKRTAAEAGIAFTIESTP